MRTPHVVRIARELLRYSTRSRRWWLIALSVVSIALLGLVVAAASPASPFVYTLF